MDTVFGYPGGAILPLYDALIDAPIRHILTVHEQGAAHAADGYARASGRVGVCIATSGPGATNLVTGLATAYMDSVPMVAITGQVGTSLLGRDAFQEIDITGLTMPITKHNFLVRNVAGLADTLCNAFYIAQEGRPGPVLVDIPRDVLLAETDFTPCDLPLWPNRLASPPDSLNASIQQARVMLEKSQRPLLLVGGGAIRADAAPAVNALCQALSLPSVSTLMGLGALSPELPQYLGLTGMHGHKVANMAVAASDLLIAVGTRFSDRVTGDRLRYANGKTIIQLDIDRAEVGKNIDADLSIIGDLRQSLEALRLQVSQYPQTGKCDWLQKIGQWQIDYPYSCDNSTLNPQWMMRHMSAAVGKLPVCWVTDVGQHQMWAAQHLTITNPRTWITSGGLGTMGFGLPAALGVNLAQPEQRVVLIAGDGGFKMTGLELYTAALERIRVTCVIVNNQSLGMVRQWQQLFFGRRYSATILPAFDFAAFAGSCNVPAVVTDTPQAFADAFATSLHAAGPFVIVANISPDCLVEPMVCPGKNVDQFIASATDN